MNTQARLRPDPSEAPTVIIHRDQVPMTNRERALLDAARALITFDTQVGLVSRVDREKSVAIDLLQELFLATAKYPTK